MGSSAALCETSAWTRRVPAVIAFELGLIQNNLFGRLWSLYEESKVSSEGFLRDLRGGIAFDLDDPVR